MVLLEFAGVALAHLLAVMSPGPDFLMCVRQSLQHGLRTGVWTAIGIGAGIGVHVAYSIGGFALLVRADARVFTAIQWLGGLWLLHLAWKCWRAEAMQDACAADRVSARPTISRAFWIGFVTNALNPKATLFFLALFTTVIAASTSLVIQLFYGVWMMIVTALWFALVARIMVQPALRAAFLRKAPLINKGFAVLLAAFALRLLWGETAAV